jgi:hypothetical protein
MGKVQVTDDVQNGASAQEFQGRSASTDEQSSTEFRFTWLRNQFAYQKRLIRLASPDNFAACLRATIALTKPDLPWAKLADFGPTRSPAGSFRYDANVIGLFGCEGDFDGDRVPIEDAASLIQAAGIASVLNETTTPGHWRIWLPSTRIYHGSPDELRALRARWVARVNGVLGGILAPESFVLSQAFYVGSLKDQPPIKVIVTEGARIDLCDDLDAAAIYKNGTSSPTEHRQIEEFEEDPSEDDDDPRLLTECKSRVANFAKTCGYGTTPTGERAHRLVQWLADIGTRDGLTPSVEMIYDAIEADYPNTTAGMIHSMLSRRKDPRGWDVIDAPPELPWEVWAAGLKGVGPVETQEMADD